MKNKLCTILLIGVLVFSTLGLALASQVTCPRCHGNGTLTCPNCGGTGVLVPNLIMTSNNPYVENDQTIVKATYKNQESYNVTGTITASIQDHSTTSTKMDFPPNEDVPVTLTIDYVGTYSMLQLVQSVRMQANPDNVTCPECTGTGTITCPQCKGTGFVDSSLISGGGLNPPAAGSISPTVIGGIAAGAVIAVVAVVAVVMLKRRGVNEKSLRKMPSGDFQQWVLKKLDGTPATSKDIAMGIDGFSRLQEPIAIKQSDTVGLAVIDSFAAALAKSRARGGTIVAFGFSDDAVRGKIRARTTYRLNIEMMTVQDIMNRR